MPKIQQKQTLSLEEIAQITDGVVFGEERSIVRGVCSLDEPAPECIAFSNSKSNIALGKQLEGFSGAALFVGPKIVLAALPANICGVQVQNPLKAMVQVTKLLHPFWLLTSSGGDQQISARAEIASSARIGRNVHIGAFCVIGEDVEIADEVIIHPQVVVYPGAKIGRAAVIHSGAIIREETEVGSGVIVQNGAVIGSDGFGYYPDQGGLQAVPQVGKVILSQGVEVGANSCIDRATFGTTTLGFNTKIDNLVQIGHNTKIGNNSIVCGHSGISGSCAIGNGVTIAGGVGIADHVTIEDGAVFAGRSSLANNYYTKGVYAGYPAIPASRWRRQQVALSRLATKGGAAEELVAVADGENKPPA